MWSVYLVFEVYQLVNQKRANSGRKIFAWSVIIILLLASITYWAIYTSTRGSTDNQDKIDTSQTKTPAQEDTFITVNTSAGPMQMRADDNVTEERMDRCTDLIKKVGDLRFSVGAVLNDDVKLCVESSAPDNCRDEYYFFKTIVTSQNLCNNIQHEPFTDFCNMIQNNTPECDMFSSTDEKIMCEVTFGASISECDKISDTNIIDYCKNLAPFIEYVKTKDANSCNKLDSHRFNTMCQRFLIGPLMESEIPDYCKAYAFRPLPSTN